MLNITSEVLPSGAIIEVSNSGTIYLHKGGVSIKLTKEDIARMDGIAYPTKRHACCKTKFEQAIEETAKDQAYEAE